MYQLKQLLKLGASSAEEEMVKWAKRGEEVRALALGKAESQAALNLCVGMHPDLVAGLATVANRYGVNSGPINHDGLSCTLLCMGQTKDLAEPNWKENMKTSEYSSQMMLKRIVHDFEDMPKVMRKTLNSEGVEALWTHASAFAYARKVFMGMVDDATFQAEWPDLEQKYLDHYLDADLMAEVKHLQHPWTLGCIPDVRSVMKRQQDRTRQKDLHRAEELRLRVNTCTFEQLQADITVDYEKINEPMEMKKKAVSMQCQMEMKYHRSRYEKGRQRIEELMSQRLAVKHIGKVSLLMQEFSLFKKQTEELRGGLGKSFHIVVLDFSGPVTNSETDSMIRVGSDLCHQCEQHAALLLYPQMYSGLTAERMINGTRQIEDRLLKSNITLEKEFHIALEVEADHSGDSRPLSQRACLCLSQGLASRSPWLLSVATRGRVGPVPLVRVRNMVTGSDTLLEPRNLSPGERAAQKGHDACAAIMSALLDGLGLGAMDRVTVVEPAPRRHGDWMLGTWKLQQDWTMAGSKPLVVYLGGTTDEDTSQRLSQLMSAKLMREWWNIHPEAGPANPTPLESIAKPVLSMLTWQDDVPVFPAGVGDKFQNTPMQSAWETLLGTHTQRFPASMQGGMDSSGAKSRSST